VSEITRKYNRRLCAAIFAQAISSGATPEEASRAAMAAWDRILAAREAAKKAREPEIRLPWFIQAARH
jgi:hypothetical protein